MFWVEANKHVSIMFYVHGILMPQHVMELYVEVCDVFSGFGPSSSIPHAVPILTRPIHSANLRDSVDVELSEFDSDYVANTGLSNESESSGENVPDTPIGGVLQSAMKQSYHFAIILKDVDGKAEEIAQIYGDLKESYKILILLQALSHCLPGTTHDCVAVPHYNRNIIDRDFSQLEKVFWAFPYVSKRLSIGSRLFWSMGHTCTANTGVCC
ncbi:hypothetical protein Ahy_B06g084759 [Arachis hypogaea]|uniref:Uncharacterized protein n=1 Tax=Arachis hypogaea TaxID=3818 RepID=A0A444YSQ1_ARAHY|nr:hypothetical protein Ahy_B06g084759 [Arachis hypogaea]